jgi:hypothetical protein
MSNLNLNISLPQSLVLEVLNLINDQEINLSDYIASQLQADVEKESVGGDYEEQHLILQQAVYCASYKKVGESFTLKEIFFKKWGSVKSPRVFGRKFKKVMTTLNIAEVTGKQADNKLIYTRTDKEINMAAYFADGNDIYDDNWNG